MLRLALRLRESLTILLWLLLTSTCHARHWRLALAPKSIDNIFFHVSRDGCFDQAEQLSTELGLASGGEDSLECLYIGPSGFHDGNEQARILDLWLDLYEFGAPVEGLEGVTEPFDAVSISVTNPDTMRPVIKRAVRLGIPVVTFDSDMPEGGDSGRTSYIGTDNYFFGQQLGKVLHQILPTGGTYHIVTDPTPNIIARERGVRDELTAQDGVWKELPSLDMKGNNTYAIEIMRQASLQDPPPTAIIPTMGGPMFLQQDWLALVKQFPNVTLVVADGLAVQLELLGRNKAAGLVAQMPYEMGTISMSVLWDLLQQKQAAAATTKDFTECGDGNCDLPTAGAWPDFIGTNVIQHLQIPLVLPELVVDQNYLGNLRYAGRVLAGLVSLAAAALLAWMIQYRKERVVRVSQPIFLAMVAIGSWIMGLALLPLSFDDQHKFSERRGRLACMAVPWMTCIGFTVAFSALFAKTWRVNRLFQAQQNFQRIEVSIQDVLKPFAVLLTANVATLMAWTFISPLEYVRRDAPGLDAWNRVIATYGKCQPAEGDIAWPYWTILALLNGSVLVMANSQAYQTRHLQTTFTETQSIGMVLASLLQAFVIGAPVLIVVHDDPIAYYWTLTLLIFVVCMAILFIVFYPKLMQWYSLSKSTQHLVINQAIQDGSAHARRVSAKKKNPQPEMAQANNHHTPANATQTPTAESISPSLLPRKAPPPSDFEMAWKTEADDPSSDLLHPPTTNGHQVVEIRENSTVSASTVTTRKTGRRKVTSKAHLVPTHAENLPSDFSMAWESSNASATSSEAPEPMNLEESKQSETEAND